MNAIVDRALVLMRGIAGLRATYSMFALGVATLELRWADSMSVHDQIRGAESARRAIRKAGIRCHILVGATRDAHGPYGRLRLIAPRRRGVATHAERYAVTATQADLDAAAARKPRCTGPRHGQRIAQEMCFVSARGHGRKLAAARHIVAAQERNLSDELNEHYVQLVPVMRRLAVRQ